MIPTTFYILRHGESEFNSSEVNKKTLTDDLHFNPQLTETGKDQIQKIDEKLRTVNFDAIISSDMPRARETAEIIARKRNLAVITTPLIRERRFTTASEPIEEIKKRVRVTMSQLDDAAKMAYKYQPSDESAEESAKRLLNYLETITSTYPDKIVMIVNHGNNMRSFLTYLDWAKYDELPSGSIVNGGYFVLESNGVDFYVKDTYGITKQQGTTRTL